MTKVWDNKIFLRASRSILVTAHCTLRIYVVCEITKKIFLSSRRLPLLFWSKQKRVHGYVQMPFHSTETAERSRVFQWTKSVYECRQIFSVRFICYSERVNGVAGAFRLLIKNSTGRWARSFQRTSLVRFSILSITTPLKCSGECACIAMGTVIASARDSSSSC